MPVNSLTRTWRPTDDLRAFRELVATLRNLRLDVLHTHNPKTGVMGRVAGRLAGVPVVVTDRGGPPEFVTDQVTGLLVDPEDVHALAEHIRRLDTDPELRHRLGAAGHAAVTGFTWVGAARLYSKVFEAATSAA